MDDKKAEVKLLIGAGPTRVDGWTPIDRKLGTEAFPLPEEYAAGTVDEMRASHILEHFPFTDRTGEPSVREVLLHWVDRLKAGGRLRIAVPDTDLILDMRDDPLRLRYLMGGQTDANDVHKSAFTESSLRELMEDCGLVQVTPWESDNTDTASHKVSLNLEGYKPLQPVNVNASEKAVKICAFMSVPRYGANMAWGCIIDALMKFRIPVRRGTGAFWSNTLENLFEGAIQDDLDWILTIDYDSIFTAEQLGVMLESMSSRHDIDAMCAMQARREGETPLCTIEGKKEKTINPNEPFQITTGHFGLTIIRVEALKQIPRPWFFGVPNASGTYIDENTSDNVTERLTDLRRWCDIEDSNHGRIDADIWFWHQWKHAGKNLYMHPESRIGHLEEKVLYFDQDMKAQSIYMRQYRELHSMPTERKRR
jgi:hypothetical protein